MAEHVNDIGRGDAPDRDLWQYAPSHPAGMVRTADRADRLDGRARQPVHRAALTTAQPVTYSLRSSPGCRLRGCDCQLDGGRDDPEPDMEILVPTRNPPRHPRPNPRRHRCINNQQSTPTEPELPKPTTPLQSSNRALTTRTGPPNNLSHKTIRPQL